MLRIAPDLCQNCRGSGFVQGAGVGRGLEFSQRYHTCEARVRGMLEVLGG